MFLIVCQRTGLMVMDSHDSIQKNNQLFSWSFTCFFWRAGQILGGTHPIGTYSISRM